MEESVDFYKMQKGILSREQWEEQTRRFSFVDSSDPCFMSRDEHFQKHFCKLSQSGRYVSVGKVISVYDGDTITVACMDILIPGEEYLKVQVRISGIDCPEIRATGREKEDPSLINEKAMAKVVKKYLSDILLDKVVILENIKFGDKYGRLLADVTALIDGAERSVSEHLIEKRMAVPYDGNKKNPPADWKEYMNGSG